MILILEYSWGGEYEGGTEIHPIEYSSKDDFLIDFQIACEECYENKESLEFFKGHSWEPTDFMEHVLVKEGRKSKQVVS